MPALGVIVADVKQRYTVRDSICPEKLVHRQLADDVLVQGVLIVAADTELQVPEVIVQLRASNRGAKLAVQSHARLPTVPQLCRCPHPEMMWRGFVDTPTASINPEPAS